MSQLVPIVRKSSNNKLVRIDEWNTLADGLAGIHRYKIYIDAQIDGINKSNVYKLVEFDNHYIVFIRYGLINYDVSIPHDPNYNDSAYLSISVSARTKSDSVATLYNYIYDGINLADIGYNISTPAEAPVLAPSAVFANMLTYTIEVYDSQRWVPRPFTANLKVGLVIDIYSKREPKLTVYTTPTTLYPPQEYTVTRR